MDENEKLDTRKTQASYNLLIISKEKESYQKKNMLNKKVYRDFRPYIAKKQFLCPRILKSQVESH